MCRRMRSCFLGTEMLYLSGAILGANHTGECTTTLSPGPHHDAPNQAGALLAARVYRVNDDSGTREHRLRVFFLVVIVSALFVMLATVMRYFSVAEPN